MKKLNKILLWLYVRMKYGKPIMRGIMRLTHPKKVNVVEYGWVRIQ